MKLSLTGMIGRLFASAIVVAGFYLLWLGFVEGNALKAVPGAILIPAGLYLMVSHRRSEIRRDSDRAINYHRQDSLVVLTSAALRDWHNVSDRRELDIDLTDCMDRAPAVGLGLSLAQPDRRVLGLDCDATLRTDLASLATIGEATPSNFVHFVLEDADHTSTDGMPIRGLDQVDFEGMARSAGYAHTCRFDNLEEFPIGLEDIMARSGPTLVAVKVLPEPEPPAFPERTMADGWAEVRRALSEET